MPPLERLGGHLWRFGTTSGNAVVGSQDTTARVWGVVGGADYKVSPDTLLGFALAGGGYSYRWPMRWVWPLGRSGRRFAAYSVRPMSRRRWPMAGTTSHQPQVALAGSTSCRAASGPRRFRPVRGGYRFATPVIGITPYAAAQVISFRLPDYARTGAGRPARCSR